MKKEMVYKKDGFIDFAPGPQVIGEEIERLKKENDGRITPKDVVDSARDDSSPLHACFDWNDATAAEKQREQIARLLIKSYTIVIKHHIPVRQNFSVKTTQWNGKQERSYVGVKVATQNQFETQFKKEALDYLKSFVKRFQMFPYLSIEVDRVKNIIFDFEMRQEAESAKSTRTTTASTVENRAGVALPGGAV